MNLARTIHFRRPSQQLSPGDIVEESNFCALFSSNQGELEEIIQQPAKQAVRVLAPGDGEAEPGERTQYASQPTKWATDDMRHNQPGLRVFHLSPASQAL